MFQDNNVNGKKCDDQPMADWWQRWKCCCPVFYSPVMKTFNYGYWHLPVDLAIGTLFYVKVEIGHCIIFLFSTVFVLNCFGWWYLCPGRFRCIRRLDCTILIGSAILFRLARHDTLQGYNYHNCRIFNYFKNSNFFKNVFMSN